MFFFNVAALAALSAVSDAFLIPPHISKADIDTVYTLPFEATAEGISKTVDLKCTGCPVPAISLQGSSLEHVDSTLELKYTVEQNAEDGDRLLLNGMSIYPPNLASIEPFKATQKFSEDQPFETQENIRLGYEMSIRPIQKDSNELELIAINVHVFEVADKFVEGIDTVELQLLKTPTGKLMIASTEQKPAASTSLGFINDDKDCTSALCKWRAIIAAKLAHLKPLKAMCGKGKGSKTADLSSGVVKAQDTARPHHKDQGKHKEGHRHHRHRGFAKFMHGLRQVAVHVLVPIFIGMAAGITATIVGGVIGQLVVLAWRSIRGGHPIYSRLSQTEIIDEERKIPIIVPQVPPPVYEDAIVVEDVTNEKK